MCFRLPIVARPSERLSKNAQPAVVSVKELVNSRLQANDSSCTFDSCHLCKPEQRDFEKSHWLWCDELCHMLYLLCVGHY